MKTYYYDDHGNKIETTYSRIPSNWHWVSTHNGVDHYIRTDGQDFYVC